VHGRPLVYLDSASTAQKPRAVIDAVSLMFERECANVHRGVHALSAAATERYEAVREKVRRFLGAASAGEIVFTRSATEAVNLVAQSFGRAAVGPGDEVLVSTLEHHSNLVPWQMLCAERGAALRASPLDARGQIDLAAFAERLSPRTRIVAVAHVSNALGTVMPVRELVRLARAASPGVAVVVDGAQAVPHLRVDVGALDCDFYCFSGHKLFGPTGTGVLYGKRERLAAMGPWQGGGDMIVSVSFAGTLYAEPPHRFEAGTPNIAGIVGLGAAVDYVEALGLDAIAAHERALLDHGARVLATIPGLQILGPPGEDRVGILSFVLPGIHPHDVGTLLDHHGIAVRTGHHCAQPLMEHLGVAGTTRASLAPYNTRADLDALAAALGAVVETFR
jgi:cysteine desulfurase / selenocysteine lyase